jgi:hypothetical protein
MALAGRRRLWVGGSSRRSLRRGLAGAFGPALGPADYARTHIWLSAMCTCPRVSGALELRRSRLACRGGVRGWRPSPKLEVARFGTAKKHRDGVWQSWPCVGFMPPLLGHSVASMSDSVQRPRSSVCIVVVLSGFVGLAGGRWSCLLSHRRPRAGWLARTFLARSSGFAGVACATSWVGNLGCGCGSLGRWTAQVTQRTVWATGENL